MEERIQNLERAFAADPCSFQTAYWIGESYRTLSFEGAAHYKNQAEQAIQWFDRSAHLNRFDPYPHMRKGMCLDWLKRYTEGQEEIQKALALDPEHHIVLAIAGWHYYQVENDETALLLLLASHDRNYWNNPVMRAYLVLVSDRIQSKKK
jgi:Flp pilus assembly protein TadD